MSVKSRSNFDQNPIKIDQNHDHQWHLAWRIRPFSTTIQSKIYRDPTELRVQPNPKFPSKLQPKIVKFLLANVAPLRWISEADCISNWQPTPVQPNRSRLPTKLQSAPTIPRTRMEWRRWSKLNHAQVTHRVSSILKTPYIYNIKYIAKTITVGIRWSTAYFSPSPWSLKLSLLRRIEYLAINLLQQLHS